MKQRYLCFAAVIAVCCLLVQSREASAQCPAFGADSTCGTVITITPTNGAMITQTGQGPYDGFDDTMVGVVNNSNVPITSLVISSTLGIYGFDGDGIDTYGAPGNAMDWTGYGGPNTYFTHINGGQTSGTVNFVTPLAPKGGSTYFSLENALASTAPCSDIVKGSVGTPVVTGASVAGTTGSLDFNFNPGPLSSQAASAQILSFSSNGTLTGGPTLTGDASGNLPSAVSFTNGTGFNDYFENFKYGSSLSFDISLYGPALSSPDGTSTSGSAFAFSMFSDAAGTIPVLTSDTVDGFAYTVAVNLNGTTTATNYITSGSPVSPTPEPGGLLLVGSAAALGIVCSIRSKMGRSAAGSWRS